MAPVTEERRADSVAVSRSTVKLVTTISSSIVLGVSVVLWNVVIDNVRLDERVKKLEEFGPKTGERFTAQDGSDLKRWLLRLQNSVDNHKGLGEHVFAKRRLDKLESCCDKIQEDCVRNGGG